MHFVEKTIFVTEKDIICKKKKKITKNDVRPYWYQKNTLQLLEITLQ